LPGSLRTAHHASHSKRWIKTQCKSKGGSVIPEVAVMKTVATVLLLLGVSALVLVPANTMRSKHHGRGYEKKCANSTDQAECLRRVKVCHSVLGRLEHLKDCANQLNIELPPGKLPIQHPKNEPELLEKLVDRINFCPPESSFRAFYKCAWQGCTTP
ncbi:hypothetical protein Hamer_G017245, partial [Homarus americanus]